MPTECKCVRCPWPMLDHSEDCYECDGSGIIEKCDACFGPECHACETRVLGPQRDMNGIPFCDGCFAELKKEMPDDE